MKSKLEFKKDYIGMFGREMYDLDEHDVEKIDLLYNEYLTHYYAGQALNGILSNQEQIYHLTKSEKETNHKLALVCQSVSKSLVEQLNK